MQQALQAWHAEARGSILAATVMPDHVHVLFSSGSRLSVGQCVARWKAEVLRKNSYEEKWQRDFWEHRIRVDENEERYGFYMFLNPYRAGLVDPDQAWPGWWAPEPKRLPFLAALDAQGVPPKAWMDWPAERFAGLETGEERSERASVKDAPTGTGEQAETAPC
jgi:REP element-mobilizing transposase RayT